MPTIGNIPSRVQPRQAASTTQMIQWDGKGLAGPEVAGIMVGVTVIISALAIVVLWFLKRGQRREFRQRQKEKAMAIEGAGNGVVDSETVEVPAREKIVDNNAVGSGGATASTDYAAGSSVGHSRV